MDVIGRLPAGRLNRRARSSPTPPQGKRCASGTTRRRASANTVQTRKLAEQRWRNGSRLVLSRKLTLACSDVYGLRYSVSCAGVWALILAAGKRWADQEDWDRLRATCAGWWMGWTSATIARVAYPPSKQLDAVAE